MTTLRSTLVLSFVLSAFAFACGDDGGGTEAQGYTACGDVTCVPGQYCSDSRFSDCDDGCLSDANCLANQYCDTEAFDPTCQNRETPPMMTDGGPPPVDGLAACQAACDHFQTCGLAAGETAQCRSDCGGLTADQQRAIGNCGDVSCVSVTGCLGVECLSSDDCGFGEECLGFSCL